MRFPSRRLRANRHDAEADVVVAALGLEPEAKGGAAGPAVVGPCASSADAGSRGRGGDVGIDAA